MRAPANASGGFNALPGNNRVAIAPESANVRQLYIDQVNTWGVSIKLFIHNILAFPITFRWVTRAAILEALENSSRFESIGSVWGARIDRINGQYIFQHPDSRSYYSRSTAPHELLHLGST